MRRQRPAGLAALGLVGVTAVWGVTFVVVKDAVERMPVMDFLAIRFLLAALVMIAIRPSALAGIGRPGARHGALLGLALGVGYIAQTYGLQHTSASVSGFITGMFVVFTPLIAGLVLRRHVPATAWIGVAVAMVGLAVISLKGFAIGPGELLTLVCAICFAIHIVGLGEWAGQHGAYPLAVTQLLAVGAICLVIGAADGLTMPPDAGVWGAVLLTAVLATAAAFVIQTWAQSILSPTRAAVIMTMEPVFAGLFGVLLGGDELTVRILLGGALVLSAMYLVELGPRRSADAEVGRLEA
ncbi:MAG: DMT family transporter [Sporichthyaceae bacterium]|nr:DMT family transporter [Sporichthyaceae bacterium]